MDLVRLRRLVSTGAARVIREAAGLSLAEAAAAIGVHKTSLWRWETQSRSPRGDAAARYLAFLDEMTGTGGKNA